MHKKLYIYRYINVAEAFWVWGAMEIVGQMAHGNWKTKRMMWFVAGLNEFVRNVRVGPSLMGFFDVIFCPVVQLPHSF